MSVVLLAVLQAAPLDPSTAEPASLADVVLRQSPELQDARAQVAAAIAEQRKSQRLPNPALDLSVNTLPVGPTNPPGLSDPFLQIPNAAVSISVLLELGKREPRQEATAAAAQQAALNALDLLRRKVLELQDVIGDVAAAQVRVDALTGLRDDAKRLTELQQARADKGDTSGLDADRARLELEGAQASLGAAEEALAESLRGCVEVIAAPCLPFSNVTQAAAWLERPPALAAEGPQVRPDLRALEASERSARAQAVLASRRWLPDPTVRVGYVRDQFVISGNQQNSLFVGLSFPLPVFDHGQDDEQAARVAAESAGRARVQLSESATAQLAQLDAEVRRVEARQMRVKDSSLPLARSVVDRLGAAVARGGAPIQELLLARRSLAELLLLASDLDRTVFHLHVARARLGSTLELPEELKP